MASRPRNWTSTVGHPAGSAAGVRCAQPARNRQVGGLAPLNADRGKRSGARHIRGGRAEVRAVLSRARLPASRCNPVLNAVYPHLLARGKAQKVALTAAMRKLLVILNAMINTQTRWNASLKNCA